MVTTGRTTNKVEGSPLNFIREMASVVEATGVDIAPDYKDFADMMLALANSLGESGRDFAHTFCSKWSRGTYNYAEIDKQYSQFLKNAKGGNSLGTVYHLFQKAGLSLPKGKKVTQKTGDTPVFEEKNMKSVIQKDEAEILSDISLPSLPAFPHYDWPEPLATFLKFGNSRAEKDILLLGGIIAIGATFRRKLEVLYAGNIYYPYIFFNCVAPSSSGKGKLSYYKDFLESMHRAIREDSMVEEKKIEEANAAVLSAQRKGNDASMAIKEPKRKMLLIPADTTQSGFLKNLNDSDSIGITITSELDTLNRSLNSKNGGFSAVLRDAFDHQKHSYSRKTNAEYVETDNLCFALIAAGTPNQTRGLVQNSEDGLFARILYYCMEGTQEWINPFEGKSGRVPIGEEFNNIGKAWETDVYLLLANISKIRFSIKSDQRDMFNLVMSELLEKAYKTGNQAMQAFVKRLGINLARMMAVVAFLRVKDEFLLFDETGAKKCIHLTIDDADCFAVLGLAEILYAHANRVLGYIPEIKTQNNGSELKETLLGEMAGIFSTEQWHKKGEAMEIPFATRKTWLQRLKKAGAIMSIAPATYKKL